MVAIKLAVVFDIAVVFISIRKLAAFAPMAIPVSVSSARQS
jgi:hypothetical protein